MLSVFIVDDEYLIRAGLRQLIPWEDHGFCVVGEAASAEQALEEIRPENTNILITDIRLPEMSGIDLCRQIKARYPQIEVIVMTGYDEFDLVLKALRAGVVDYILKPIGIDNLVSALNEAKAKIEKRNGAVHQVWSNKIVDCIRNGDMMGLEYCLLLMSAMLKEQGLWNANALLILDDLLYAVLNSYPDMRFCERYLEDFRSAAHVDPDEGMQNLTRILKKILKVHSSTELDLVEKAKVYIEEHYHEKITLQSVAEAVFSNAAYLSSLFMRETGINYKSYVLRVRIRHAKRLLKETNYSIEQVSNMAGFGNSKYFAKIFKDETGVTPSAYRR